MPPHLDATEWLEAQRLGHGSEADFAAEILDTWLTWDEVEGCEPMLEARGAATHAEGRLADLESALIGSPLACEYVTTNHDKSGEELRDFLNEVQDMDVAMHEIREVLVRGGVLGKDDTASDLAAIIAMFVPPA